MLWEEDRLIAPVKRGVYKHIYTYIQTERPIARTHMAACKERMLQGAGVAPDASEEAKALPEPEAAWSRSGT